MNESWSEPGGLRPGAGVPITVLLAAARGVSVVLLAVVCTLAVGGVNALAWRAAPGIDAFEGGDLTIADCYDCQNKNKTIEHCAYLLRDEPCNINMCTLDTMYWFQCTDKKGTDSKQCAYTPASPAQKNRIMTFRRKMRIDCGDVNQDQKGVDGVPQGDKCSPNANFKAKCIMKTKCDGKDLNKQESDDFLWVCGKAP